MTFQPPIWGFVNLSIGSSPYPPGPQWFFDGRYRRRLGISWQLQHPVFGEAGPGLLLKRARYSHPWRRHCFFGSIWGVWTPGFHTRLGAVHLSRNMSAFGWDIFPSENIWTTIESTNFNCIYMNCIVKRRNKWVSMRNNNELHSGKLTWQFNRHHPFPTGHTCIQTVHVPLPF